MMQIFYFPSIFREMEKQKTALLDAYVRKFIALGKIHLVATKLNETEVTKSDEIIPWAELDVIYTELGKFIDYNDQKVHFIEFLDIFIDSNVPNENTFCEWFLINRYFCLFQVIALSLWHAYLKQHHGRMSKILQKIFEEKYQKEVMEEMQYAVRANKWEHVGDLVQRMITAFPHGYRLF